MNNNWMYFVPGKLTTDEQKRQAYIVQLYKFWVMHMYSL